MPESPLRSPTEGSLPLTRHTLIEQVRLGNVDALSELIERYRPALVRFASKFLRLKGDSDDAAQEISLRLISKDNQLIKKYDRVKGRFHDFLFQIAWNVVMEMIDRKQAIKRGGHAMHVSIDSDEGRRAVDRELAPRKESFRVELDAEVTLKALERLKRHFEAAGRPQVFQALELCVLSETRKTYEQAAQVLGSTVGGIRNDISTARQLLQERFIPEEIAQFEDKDAVSDEAEKLRNRLRRLPRKGDVDTGQA